MATTTYVPDFNISDLPRLLGDILDTLGNLEVTVQQCRQQINHFGTNLDRGLSDLRGQLHQLDDRARADADALASSLTVIEEKLGLSEE